MLTGEKILKIAADTGMCSEHGDQYGYIMMNDRNVLDFARAILKEADAINQQMLTALKAAHRMLTRDYIDDGKMKVVDQCDEAITTIDKEWTGMY